MKMSNEKGPETYPGLFSKRNPESKRLQVPRFTQPVYLNSENISRRVSQSPSIYLDDDHSADDEADYDSRQHVIL
jgi:hypothetical protein